MNTFQKNHLNTETLMRNAIQLALKAQFQTEPNPLVGAVLVNAQGEIISEGYHAKAGMPHAEVIALEKFDKVPQDAILFITLEPCSNYGKTPPCTELILKKQVRQVVIGYQDPNPQVAGNGIRILQESGVKITSGVCEKDCEAINRVYNKHIVSRLPYLTLKTAMSLDGKIAMPSGESKWITGEIARARAHQLRSQHQAIAVGSNTLISDNPKLDDRISKNARQPVKVVFSSNGEIPFDSIFIQQKNIRRILLAGNRISPQCLERLQNEGVDVFQDDFPKPRIKWGLQRLYQEGICSLLLEGGAELTASFLKENMLDQIKLFISGKIIGNSRAQAWSGDIGIESLGNVPRICFDKFENLGNDLLITGFFSNHV